MLAVSRTLCPRAKRLRAEWRDLSPLTRHLIKSITAVFKFMLRLSNRWDDDGPRPQRPMQKWAREPYLAISDWEGAADLFPALFPFALGYSLQMTLPGWLIRDGRMSADSSSVASEDANLLTERLLREPEWQGKLIKLAPNKFEGARASKPGKGLLQSVTGPRLRRDTAGSGPRAAWGLGQYAPTSQPRIRAMRIIREPVTCNQIPRGGRRRSGHASRPPRRPSSQGRGGDACQWAGPGCPTGTESDFIIALT
jgi:hypothetical protein